MSFVSPWMLVLLVMIPVVVAFYGRAIRRRARRSEQLAAQGLVLTAAATRMRTRRHVPFAFFALALTVLVVALARPEANLTTPRREGTVILAFDVSNSMAAKDLEPTRIEAAKTAARAFVEQQPSTIRIGVVAFGDGAVIAQQPTRIRADVIAAINRLSLEGGTSLGQGLYSSLNAIAGKPLTIDEAALASDSATVDIGYFGSSAIVVLSDGENTGRTDPHAVAEIASVAGVHVHTIGIGTVDGTVVSINGFSVATKLDRELLTDIYKSIDLEFTAHTEHTEITALFTAAGVILLVIGALLSVFWFGRVM